MKYYKFENEKWTEVNEYEFYRYAINGFDSVKETQTVSQVCLQFYKDFVEIARQVCDVCDLKR